VTPEQARAELVQGNLSYTADLSAHPRRNSARRQATAEQGQRPIATVVGCSDSRVPVELIFHQGVGDLFVVRTAGHVVGDSALASIEYAVDHLGIPLVLVLAHRRCGAVTAAVQGGVTHGHLPKLMERLAPAVAQARAEAPGVQGAELVERAILANLWHTLNAIRERSAIVRAALAAGSIRLEGALYDLATGEVDFLGSQP
jgi:carbonic anhydrase